MPVDMSNPSGFNQFLDDIRTAFEGVAVEDHMQDGENLDVLNAHVTGPVNQDALASQYAEPFIWTVPRNHSPAYATTVTDQGELQFQVVVFAADQDQDTAFDKATHLGGRVVNNVEADRALRGGGQYDNDAQTTWLRDFKMDFMATSGSDSRAQVKYCQMVFDVDVKRNYR